MVLTHRDPFVIYIKGIEELVTVTIISIMFKDHFCVSYISSGMSTVTVWS